MTAVTPTRAFNLKYRTTSNTELEVSLAAADTGGASSSAAGTSNMTNEELLQAPYVKDPTDAIWSSSGY